MDLLEILREMQSVERVTNFPEDLKGCNKLRGMFFICPKLKGKGYRMNQRGTGLTVRYDQEGRQKRSAFERIKKVKAFLNEFKSFSLPFEWETRAVIASAEAKLLFPESVAPPFIPLEIDGFLTISTYELLECAEMKRFYTIYKEKPWLVLPKDIIEQESFYTANVLSHAKAPGKLIVDFVNRVFSEYALEGVWFSKGKFGKNPIILGVETPGVPTLINAALPRKKRIPIIQLK